MMIPITLTLDSQVKIVRVNNKLTKYKIVNNNGKMKIALPRPSTFRPKSSKSTNIVFSFFVWYLCVLRKNVGHVVVFPPIHPIAPLCKKHFFLQRLHLLTSQESTKISRYIVCFGEKFVNTFAHIAKIKWQILSRYSTNMLKINHRFDIIVPIIICR